MRVLYVLSVLLATAALAEGPFEFQFQQLAPDVWTGVRSDPPRFPVMGNTTFVIGEEGVVVYDGGGMPAMTDQTIAKIRSLTDKPVTHVVISHWHGDHHLGVFRFAEEFPDVAFVAHEFTRDVINSTRLHYVDRQRSFLQDRVPQYQTIVETGVDSDGKELGPVDKQIYQRIIADAEAIDTEFNRARLTPPNVVFTDRYTITSGKRRIELLFLGHANTAGDIVVLPSPYAFNVPPRAWADTLRALNNLGYKTLVPGHGPIQRNRSYVDLLIEVADSITSQRDALIAQGKSHEEVQAALDFSAFELRFTAGDEYVRQHYEAWFEGPLRAAAIKALTGEPMVAIEPPVALPFDDPRWQIDAEEAEIGDYLGQPSLRLRGGKALLKDLDLTNALVEFDVAVADERGFMGLAFRVQDEANFEEFYIRPHQSGFPDANQYQPVFNGSTAWQLYHGEGYGAPVAYTFGKWMHVKIVYAGDRAEVSIDSKEPVLRVDNLRREDRAGSLGFTTSRFSAAHFSNLTYVPLAEIYSLPSKGPAAAEPVPGTIASWEVSPTFDGESLRDLTRLSAAELTRSDWTTLDAETTGITNLARVAVLGDQADTVFARFVVDAREAGSRVLQFGYSDLARVYLNGTLLYQGDNRYRSRDYRYLGTIGLFDSVVLPLKAGRNEVRIAVTEEFGGWGVIGRLSEQP